MTEGRVEARWRLEPGGYSWCWDPAWEPSAAPPAPRTPVEPGFLCQPVPYNAFYLERAT